MCIGFEIDPIGRLPAPVLSDFPAEVPWRKSQLNQSVDVTSSGDPSKYR